MPDQTSATPAAKDLIEHFLGTMAHRPERWVDAMLAVGMFPEDGGQLRVVPRVFCVCPDEKTGTFAWMLLAWDDHAPQEVLDAIIDEVGHIEGPTILWLHLKDPVPHNDGVGIAADATVRLRPLPSLSPEMLDDMEYIQAFAQGALDALPEDA